jgi:hypothetical protein
MLRFRDAWQDPLEWVQVRPLAALYELISPHGIVARMDARGHALTGEASAETSDGRMRFHSALMQTQVFNEVEMIARILSPGYHRMECAGDVLYGFHDLQIDDADDQPVLRIEPQKHIPVWRARVKLEADAIWVPELPILACWVCWLHITGNWVTELTGSTP